MKTTSIDYLKKGDIVKVADKLDPLNKATGKVEEIDYDNKDILIKYLTIPDGVGGNFKIGQVDWFRAIHLVRLTDES